MRWLKIDVETPTKIEIWEIARLCGCSRGEAFAHWFAFMSRADAITEDGYIKGLTPEYADLHAGLSGFGKAMEARGWITFTADGATIPNWDRHNGQSAKRRANDAMRQGENRKSANRSHSVRKSSAFNADSLQTREEKIREYKKPKSSPLPGEQTYQRIADTIGTEEADRWQDSQQSKPHEHPSDLD